MTDTPHPPHRVLDLGCGVRYSVLLRGHPEMLYRLGCGPLTPRANGPMRRLLALILSMFSSLSVISNLIPLEE